jgi:formate hydrogenlyase subunit 3/multisubunit Na+/H+ antiporter MnhD subunit
VLAPITPAVSAVALLPVAAVGSALIGALATALSGSRTRLRNVISIATCVAVFSFLAALYDPVYRGISHGGQHLAGVQAALPGLGPSGLTFFVDPTSLLIALITAFVWLLAMVFATSYMDGEHSRARFDSFMLLTLAGNIGVLVAGDYISLFVFFEIMAVASYVLVVHGQNPQSLRAGKLYMYMSVIGGLVLLGGILMLAAFTGGTAIAPAGDKLAELPTSLAVAIPLLLMVGFATKAGMFFLHVWLPEAHPVAPSPASALLSGLMVKVGVYGILRTATVLLIHGDEAGGDLAHSIGLALMIGAVVTMVAGMVNASFCSNAKELLAYSTISQVGFIILGIGCAAVLGSEGAMAIAAVLTYIVSHAAFKATLFLTIGAVIWRAREQRFSLLGGMAYRMPWTAVAAFVATAAIVGIPGTAGFAAKSLMHHAVVEVVSESAMGHGALPTWPFLLVEALFVGVAAGTFTYSARMFILVFLGKVPAHLEHVKPESWPMRVAYVPLVALLLTVGVLPTKFVEWFVGPALAYYGLDISGHAYHLVYDPATGTSPLAILYDPSKFAPFTTPAVTENLLAVAGSVFFAGTFFLVGHKIGVFDMPLPHWASLALWYRRFARATVGTVSRLASAFDATWNRWVWTAGVDIWLPSRVPAKRAEPALVDAGARALAVSARFSTAADRLLDRVLAGALVDAWLSEFVGVSNAPASRALSATANFSTAADHALDRALTGAMVDTWLAESVTAPEGPSAPEGVTPQVSPAAPSQPLAYSLTRESLGRVLYGWRITLFILGVVVIAVVIAVATGQLVLP